MLSARVCASTPWRAKSIEEDRVSRDHMSSSHVKQKSSPEESLNAVGFLDMPEERPPIPRGVTACDGDHRGEAVCGREKAVGHEPGVEREINENHPLSRTDIYQASKDMIFRALEIIKMKIQVVLTKEQVSARGPSKGPAPLQKECSLGRNV